MATNPQTLARAVSVIEEFEGIETEAYLDPVGIPTICAGITRYTNGEPVRMGDTCDARICRGQLQTLLEKQYIPALELIPGWAALGSNRQAALISFAWNLGAKFYGSAGFETITAALKEGATHPEAYAKVPAALRLYDKAGGQALPGLVNRRRKEGELWSMEENGVVKFTANQDTFLKKAPIPSALLSADGKRAIPRGEVVEVAQVEEIPANSHAWFTLAKSGERWAAYMPHFGSGNPPAPSTQAIHGVNWDDFSSRAGKYITVGEVLQYDKRRKPTAGSAEEKAILAVCKEFDAIREAWNGPLGVTSGYRPEPINSQVGGVSNSFHVKGMALDIFPIGESLDKFYGWLSQRWSGGLGDGRNKGFLHIDTRNGGKFSATPGVRPAAIWLY